MGHVGIHRDFNFKGVFNGSNGFPMGSDGFNIRRPARKGELDRSEWPLFYGRGLEKARFELGRFILTGTVVYSLLSIREFTLF